jgi:hypothetical protein
VDWYRVGENYAFMNVDLANGSETTGFQLKIIDLIHRKLQSMNVSEQQLRTLPKVESPVAREDQSFKDCEF